MAFPFLNQVYAGLNPNDATVNQWVANVNAAPKPVVDGTLAPGAIVMPGQPVNVNAPALAGVPAQFQAQPAPVRVPAPPPQVPQPAPQMAANAPAPQAQGPQTQDLSVGLSAAPIQYGVINTPGRAAGELNTMGPNQEMLLTKAAGTEGNAQTAAAERVATAMVAQQAPLDERAQYLTALAEREAQDQTGRNEQNRQRIEDYEREAQAFRDMKVDPDSAVSDRQKAALGVGGFVTALMDAFTSGRTNTHSAIRDAFQESKAQGIQAQQQNIANRRTYLDSVRNAMQAQREMQGDQVASTQRQAQLMKEATGAHLDQAGIGVAMSEALARGDLAQAQALSKLYQQQAAAQRYIPASGGGRMYQVKLANGAVLNMSEKEFNAYAKDNEKGTIETGQKIAVNAAEAKAKGAGKDDEARIVDLGNGQFYKARTTEEAIKLDEQRRALEQRQGAIMGVKEARKQVGFLDRVANNMTFGAIEPKSIANLDARSKALVEAEAKRSGGVVTESDREGAKLRVGDQTSFSPFKSNQERLNAVQAEIDRDKELLDRGRDITTRAPRPVKKGW